MMLNLGFPLSAEKRTKARRFSFFVKKAPSFVIGFKISFGEGIFSFVSSALQLAHQIKGKLCLYFSAQDKQRK